MSPFERYKEISLKRKTSITEEEEDALLDELDDLWKKLTYEERLEISKWSAEGMKT
jgi:hypothetical protein